MMDEDKVVETTVENYESETDSSERSLAAGKGDLTRNLEHTVQTA